MWYCNGKGLLNKGQRLWSFMNDKCYFCKTQQINEQQKTLKRLIGESRCWC